MGLSFLAPLFLAGLTAVAIPLVVHLRRRRQRREVPFPSLRFLRDAPVRTEQKRRLQNLGLLALRVGALALLAAAFARPFLDGDDEALAGTVGPREVVVLLDRSWSMTAPGRWDDARDAVGRTLAELGPRDRASLVLFDERADASIRSTSEVARVLEAVRDAEPGDGGTRFAPALRLAGSLLDASSLPTREVVLFSDLPAGAWTADDDVRLPVGASLRTEAVGASPPSQAGVLDAEVLPSAATDGDGIRVRARLRLEADAPREVEAVLEAEGRERARRRVTLEPGAPTSVVFGPVPEPEGPLPATVRMPDDAVPTDDAYHLVLRGQRRITVLVVDRPTDDDPSLHLRRAVGLSASPPMTVRRTAGSGLDAQTLAGVDVVVLNDHPVPGGDGGRALTSFVESGGGLLLAAGPDGGADTGSGALRLPARPGPVREPARGGTTRLGSVDRSHPIFEPFRETGSGDLTSARFYRTRPLTPGDSARVLVRFDDGAPALVEGRFGRGRILVWGATLNTFWTDLPVQPTFLPLMHQTVRHLASLRPAPASYVVGDALDPEAFRSRGSGEPASGSDGGSLEIVGPDGDERTVAGGADPAPVLLERAGIHRVRIDGEVRGAVAVNAPRDEELASGLDAEELAAAVTAPDTTRATAGAGASTISPGERERSQGLWRFLLVGALVLLVVETVVSNRISRSGSRHRAKRRA